MQVSLTENENKSDFMMRLYAVKPEANFRMHKRRD
jgi:hypothetical protein